MATNSSANPLDQILNGGTDKANNQAGITIKTFLLNILVSLALFVFEIVGFFWLKSSIVGRRI